MNRTIPRMMLILLFVSMFAGAFYTHSAKAEPGTIYIRADGSVDPPTPLIATVDNVTYTLTGDINDSIVIERNNIVVDGAGYTMTGSGSGNGATLTDRSNVTVKNTTIKNFYYGTYLNHTNKIALINNNIANNGIGILLNSSLISVVSGNNITNNDWAGIGLISSSNNSISGNSVTNNTWDGVGLTSSSNCNSISGNNIANNHDGIYLSDSSSNSIYHNNFRDNTQQRDMFNNTWDHGYPSGGNYWSDYVGADVKSGPNQDLLGSDGIGDSPYVIDRYPLTYPWSPIRVIEVGFSLVDTFHFNITVRNFGETAVDISKITVALINGTALEIPYYGIIPALPYRLSLNQTVTLNCPWDWTNYQGKNATIKVDTSEDHPAEVTLTLPGVIPEFPSFLILSLFFIATLPAVIVYKKKRTNVT